MSPRAFSPDRATARAQQRFRRIQEWLRRYWPLVLSAVLVVASLYIRYLTRGLTNSDMEAKILVWYAKLQRHGPLVGLGKDFYNYTPPYVYLIALATLTSAFIAPLTSIKLIALIFDVYAAVMIYLITRLHRPTGYVPVLAAAGFLAGPTFIVNSGIWGQADSTFAAFMLTCLYFLLTKKPWPAVACFAIALAIKPQGVFFGPLLLLFLLQGRIRWYHLLAVPVVYAVCMAPAVALGRTWVEVFTAYTSQAGAGKALTHNAANLYVFIPRQAFSWLLWPAYAAAGGILLAWVYFTWRTERRNDTPAIILLALICVTLVPFFLPNMRERYYYLGDILSLVLAFMLPSLWYLAVLFQVFSLLSYSMFLWQGPQSNLQLAAILSALTLVLLLRQQIRLLGTAEEPSAPASRRPRRSTR